jgi:two-component system phosphate regulon sensor histidine kinase PhoR
MTFEIWLSASADLPLLPAQLLWTAVLVLLTAFAVARSLPPREDIRLSRVMLTLLSLLLAIPAGGLAVLRFPATGASIVAGVPEAAAKPAGGLLCMALLLLTAAWFGKLPAFATGLAVGSIRSVFDTHQVTTILEYALAGWIAAEAVHQDYHGRVFSILRKPWGAALAAGLFLIPLRFGGEMGNAWGDWLTLIDYALGRMPGFIPAILVEVLAGAVIVEVLRLVIPSSWPSPKRLRHTRYDRSLAWKVSLWLILPIFFMAVALTAIVVIDARDQARLTLRQEVLGAARTARTDLPVALTTGHTLLEGIGANLPANTSDRAGLAEYLGQRLSQPPFFEQIAFLLPDGSVSAAYPPTADPFCESVIEAQGCSLALRGIAWEDWLPPDADDRVWISFTQPVWDADREIRGALIGRTSLDNNPLLKGIPAAFAALRGGQGVFLDDADQILYPPDGEPWTEKEPIERDEDGGEWFLGTMPGGGTRLAYLLPLKYPPWKVAIRVPEQFAFRAALETGLHVGLFSLLMALLIEALALFIAQQITLPLRRLAESAGLIAAGDLERSVRVESQDEIGRLGRSLESMRRNLRRQIRDQEILLEAVQGMTSTLDFDHSMNILLHSVRTATGASGVRLVLTSDLRDQYPSGNLSLGEDGKVLEAIDERILAAAGEGERQAPWTANRNSGADEGLFEDLPPGIGALIFVRIAGTRALYGALAVAFSQPQAFEVGMLDLLSGFANQASLAITNARLLEGTEYERERLAAILEAIPEGVLVVDSEDRIQYANPAAEGMLGARFSPAGGTLSATVPQPELAAFLMESAIQPRRLEFSGAEGRRLQGVARSVRSADGAGVWQVCVLQDVTAFRQLDELKSEFVHTVSHDLRRPLTMMEGLVHMIEMLGPLNPAQQEYARRIRLSAQQMNRLVEDLLDLGRLESGAEIHLAPVALAPLVERAIADLKPEAAAGGIKITARMPKDFPEIPADAALLERALGNLIENAVRFNRPGGTVEVGAELTEDSAVVWVKDSGIGIAPADQPRIFEKFFRAVPRDDPEHPAWGLGLAIVKSVAEWHRGNAWCESKLGQGSTFYLQIPRQAV